MKGDLGACKHGLKIDQLLLSSFQHVQVVFNCDLITLDLRYSHSISVCHSKLEIHFKYI